MALISPIAAFLAYGGWALWLNVHAGNPDAYSPALVHGAYAALLTLGLHVSVVRLRQTLTGVTRHPRAGTWILATLVSFIVPLVIQELVGNQRSVATILPGFLIGQCYIGALLWLPAPREPPRRLCTVRRYDDPSVDPEDVWPW